MYVMWRNCHCHFHAFITAGVIGLMNKSSYTGIKDPYQYTGTTVFKHKGKAIPLQAWTGRESSRRLRLPEFKTIGTWRWQGCQPYAPAVFTKKIFLILITVRDWVDSRAIVVSKHTHGFCNIHECGRGNVNSLTLKYVALHIVELFVTSFVWLLLHLDSSGRAV
jgi:hypothetical protein